MFWRLAFGTSLVVLGILDLWLALQSLQVALQSNDWVAYLGTFLFFAVGVGAIAAGISVGRPRRH